MADENNGKGLVQTINAWWAHPFNTSGSVMNWVLWVGIIVVAMFLWQLVLLELAREV